MSLSHAGVTVAGLAVGASLVACGGNGGDGRPIVAEDLPQVVLQREDVSIGVMTGAFVDFELVPTEYLNQFEVPRAEVEPSNVACITGAAALYDSAVDAATAFDETLTAFGELKTDPEADSSGIEVGDVSVPGLGDEAAGFRISGPTTVFCSDYENEPMDQHLVMFRQDNVLSAVTVINYESGASLPEAIELAEKQESRINQVLK